MPTPTTRDDLPVSTDKVFTPGAFNLAAFNQQAFNTGGNIATPDAAAAPRDDDDLPASTE